ncbi:hypothetical protein C8R43DRAFT_910753 [Mycena crocata]|nr:hypothetical protein C8R43DRAFT_910753 [Mycena crocata]
MLTRTREALAAAAQRTGAPLSSLVLSFGILHEVTAVVPLVAIFYAARTLGVGERVVAALPAPVPRAPDDTANDTKGNWATEKARVWVGEGQAWAGRVGRRYGVFGFEKGSTADTSPVDDGFPERIAGDVANAVVAYAATKALLPVRIGAALYLSPAFSRALVDPARRGIRRIFRRGP